MPLLTWVDFERCAGSDSRDHEGLWHSILTSAARLTTQKHTLTRPPTHAHGRTQVESALEDGRGEFQSIADTKAELLELQAEVEEAHKRLHVTQARVEQNVKRLTDLKAEAAEISRINQMSADEVTAAAATSSHPEMVEARGGAASSSGAAASTSTSLTVAAEVGGAGAARGQGGGGGTALAERPRESRVSKKSRGLASTMNLEKGLRNFWCASLCHSRTPRETPQASLHGCMCPCSP